MAAQQKLAPKQELTKLNVEDLRGHAADAAGLMRALGNESRLMILCTLMGRELSVGELNKLIPLSQSALSQQLARLRREGLVQTRRESQTIYYALCPGPADRVIHLLHELFCRILTQPDCETRADASLSCPTLARCSYA